MHFHCLIFYGLWCFPVVILKKCFCCLLYCFYFYSFWCWSNLPFGINNPIQRILPGCTNALTTFTPHISNRFAKIKRTKIDRRHLNLLFKTAMKLLHKSKPFILIASALKSTSNISCQWTVLEVFLQKCTHAVVRQN